MDYARPYLRRSGASIRTFQVPRQHGGSARKYCGGGRESIVVEWNGPTIRGFARRFPQLLENAHLIDMDYVSWYVSAHAALTSPSAGERLASVLLGLARSIGQKVSGGIELDVTNLELADSAHITRYTTSRLISKWQRAGAIRKHRGKILLRSPERFFLREVNRELPS